MGYKETVIQQVHHQEMNTSQTAHVPMSWKAILPTSFSLSRGENVLNKTRLQKLCHSRVWRKPIAVKPNDPIRSLEINVVGTRYGENVVFVSRKAMSNVAAQRKIQK